MSEDGDADKGLPALAAEIDAKIEKLTEERARLPPRHTSWSAWEWCRGLHEKVLKGE
jgi:hypothetical protein